MIQSEPRLERRKPSLRAKWRSSMSACSGVLKRVLDTADIVRDGIFRQLAKIGNQNGIGHTSVRRDLPLST
jgi:hypothetical protein